MGYIRKFLESLFISNTYSLPFHTGIFGLKFIGLFFGYYFIVCCVGITTSQHEKIILECLTECNNFIRQNKV